MLNKNKYNLQDPSQNNSQSNYGFVGGDQIMTNQQQQIVNDQTEYTDSSSTIKDVNQIQNQYIDPNMQQQPYTEDLNMQQQPYTEDPNMQQQPYTEDPNMQQQPYTEDPNMQQQPYTEDPNMQQQPYTEDPNMQQQSYTEDPNMQQQPYTEDLNMQQQPYTEDPNMQQQSYTEDPNMQQQSYTEDLNMQDSNQQSYYDQGQQSEMSQEEYSKFQQNNSEADQMSEEVGVLNEKTDNNMNREVIKFQDGVDIIALIDDMFTSAVKLGASDIHIEPFEEFLAIRFRVDGEFQGYLNFDIKFSIQILTRIEVLAGLKLDKNRVPQDGKINYKVEGIRVDMRVSTFPTMYGNKVCIRLLIKDNKIHKIDDLGYDKKSLEIIYRNLDRTYGMILMTGPTGSGKSTTLFGMISTYNPFEFNISTLEDPIEYFIPGANQSQVNAEIGYDFPDGLRCLVRQDPDIIMVGEIRDKITAQLAINAAITGHLVFSTLHANSASATIQRLMNMDVDPFLVISALNLIVSQRLVRKICENCKEEFAPDNRTMANVKEELKYIEGIDVNNLKFYRGAGCEHCKNQGYKGRISIYELLEVTSEISHIIIEKKGVAEEINKVAVKQGMITIKQNGILKAIEGLTTLEEVFIASDAST